MTIVIVIVVGKLTHAISEREQLALLVLRGMFMITFEGRFSFFVLILGFY
jgi:Zn-dependent membrane protease YugP